MSASKALTTKVLPLLVFPAISYYARGCIFGNSLHAGTFTKLAAQCTASTPFTLAYTGIELFDAKLCRLVACYHYLLDPHNVPFNIELMTGLIVIATIPFIEAARQNRNILLELHWIIGGIYQIYTGGFILPLYWLIFVLTGAATLHHDPQIAAHNSKVDQRHAESIFFAAAVGFVLPTIAMFVKHNQYTIAFWQAFPLWMIVAQRLYLAGRPASTVSGANTIKFIYTSLFLLSALPHIFLFTSIATLSSNPVSTIKSLFVPSFALLDPTSTTIDQGVFDFIKWDGFWMVVSTFSVTVWIAGKSLGAQVGLLAWWVASGVLLGPGASVVGVFWWRESHLLKPAAPVSELGTGFQKNEKRAH